jgi:Zn-dependent peptidase ImmA (M78 family)/transcriptional regulator with XRE-family HTH domain
MFTLARESRGLSQTALADKIGVTQSKISKFESGMLPIEDDDLARVADALGYPREIFFRTTPSLALSTNGFHHRKRQSLGITDQRQIHASLTLRLQEIETLLRDIEFDDAIPGAFTPIDPDRCDGDIDRIAAMVRSAWGIPHGPIDNLAVAIERCGAVVVSAAFGTDQLDAVSKICSPLPPVLFVNADLSGDRMRWTLAHEIGHLIMHTTPTPNVEGEADQFAAAFLMPKTDIHEDLCPPLDFAKLRMLKMRWKVSIQSLIYRAHEIGTISDRTYRYMFQTLASRGWRKSEPDPIAPERPTLMRDTLAVHREQHECTIEDLARMTTLHPQEFAKLYYPGGSHLRLVS